MKPFGFHPKTPARKPTNSATSRNASSNHLRLQKADATRRNEIIKSYLQLGSSSNRYAPRLPQQETKASTEQLPPTDPILGPDNLLKTDVAQIPLQSVAFGSSHLGSSPFRFKQLVATLTSSGGECQLQV